MSEFNMTQLDQDIDTLRDVYMTNRQLEALARVQALASDHARLQGKNAELAAAVRGLLDALPSSTTHPAIAAARKAVQS